MPSASNDLQTSIHLVVQTLWQLIHDSDVAAFNHESVENTLYIFRYPRGAHFVLAEGGLAIEFGHGLAYGFPDWPVKSRSAECVGIVAPENQFQNTSTWVVVQGQCFQAANAPIFELLALFSRTSVFIAWDARWLSDDWM
jgi:hypothetical protein